MKLSKNAFFFRTWENTFALDFQFILILSQVFRISDVKLFKEILNLI